MKRDTFAQLLVSSVDLSEVFMAISFDPKQIVSLEKLFMSEVIQQEALKRLHIKVSVLLQSTQSEDIRGTDKIEVRAFILAKGRQAAKMEKVGSLSLEQAVSATSWKHIPQQMDK